MKNPFENRVPSLSGPALDILPVSPSDSIDLTEVAVALYVEIGGSLTFTTARGATRTVNVPDMSILPVGAVRVHVTGTTADSIHAFVV
ncbi:spike base protein, RCAP_Rcc01079 family [Parasedimentitalea huanghaiensis]|uniref:Uncharacterized protein n=1 Tax=Parasedimentitalea huanghaiensis TaxID=2682100 RepID=A0A6L6WJN3_9RHOB|nr:hypothetical protein [Zongyanglinia huanghaiensis]MVO17378.1 hypothetical protein [Zongyanglinia huanghaiensis]